MRSNCIVPYKCSAIRSGRRLRRAQALRPARPRLAGEARQTVKTEIPLATRNGAAVLPRTHDVSFSHFLLSTLSSIDNNPHMVCEYCTLLRSSPSTRKSRNVRTWASPLRGTFAALLDAHLHVVRHDAPREKPHPGEGRAPLHDVYEPVPLVGIQVKRPVGDPAYQVIHPVVPVFAQFPHVGYYTTTPQTVSHRPYHKGLSPHSHPRVAEITTSFCRFYNIQTTTAFYIIVSP